MNRKIISLFTLLAFIIFSLSCYTIRIKEVQTVAYKKGKKVKVLSVVKTSGEHLEFPKSSPGRIYKDSIIGTIRVVRKKMEIDLANIKGIKRDQKGKILEVTNKDGKKYEVIIGTTREEEDKIIFSGELYESVSIPFSEVESVRVKKLDPFRTFLTVAASTTGVLLLVWVIAGIAVSSGN